MLALSLALVLGSAGCAERPVVFYDPPPSESPPAVNLPVELRQSNWADARGSGSCVIASTCSMLRWQLAFAQADFMRRNYAGGQTEQSIRQKLDSMRVPYESTNQADPAFLDWASRTRRGAIIWYYPSHCVTFCGFETQKNSDTVAVLLDNNRTRNFIRIPRGEFLARWRGYGGFALTVMGPPVPPPLYERWSHDFTPSPDGGPVRPAGGLLDRLFARWFGGRYELA